MTAIDVAWERPSPKACRDAAVQLVLGYLSANLSKCLTRSDIDGYLGLGIDVGLVYEDSATDELKAGSGISHGRRALEQLRALKAPAGMTVFVAVDTDTHSYAVLERHLADFGSELAVQEGFQTGIYGSYDVCAHMMSARKAARAWQTKAWSGGRVLDTACLYQNAKTREIGGIRVDLDDIRSNDYGGWKAAASGLGGKLPAHRAPLRHPAVAPAPLATYAREGLVLRRGSHGWAIKRVQLSLGVGDDGIFGPGTESAVKAFQRAHGLDDDGVIGPNTWGALLAAERCKAAA